MILQYFARENGIMKTDARGVISTFHALTLSTLVEVNMANESLPNQSLIFKKEELSRFWSWVEIKTDPNSCWEWKRFRSSHGYGQYHAAGKNWRVHRLAWAIANGREPRLNILHSCDNPPCCNPAHLREGTQMDNMRERSIRGRYHNQRCPMSLDIAREIRSRFAAGDVEPTHIPPSRRRNESN